MPQRRTRNILALGTAQTLSYGSTYYLPAILALPIARELGLTPTWVFAAFSAALLLAAALGPAAGRHIDRHGGRGSLVASSFVFALGLALLACADGALLLFVAWGVIGAGMAIGLYEAAFSTLAGIYGDHARGPITGITLLAGFASTICWPVSAYLEARWGWRSTCLVWAACHLLLGLPLNWRLPRGLASARHAAAAQTSATPPSLLPMLLLAWVFAVTWFTSTAMATHVPRLLQEAGASATAAVAAAAMIGPAQVAARALEFSLLRHVHPLLSARLATLAHPLGAVALLGAGAPAALPFALAHGAGVGALTIAKGTLPLALFGPVGYGQRQGLLMLPARLAQAASPLLFGVVIERWGTSALLLSALLGLSSFAALMAIRLRPAAGAAF